jgi:hypothetical protein
MNPLKGSQGKAEAYCAKHKPATVVCVVEIRMRLRVDPLFAACLGSSMPSTQSSSGAQPAKKTAPSVKSKALQDAENRIANLEAQLEAAQAELKPLKRTMANIGCKKNQDDYNALRTRHRGHYLPLLRCHQHDVKSTALCHPRNSSPQRYRYLEVKLVTRGLNSVLSLSVSLAGYKKRIAAAAGVPIASARLREPLLLTVIDRDAVIRYHSRRDGVVGGNWIAEGV